MTLHWVLLVIMAVASAGTAATALVASRRFYEHSMVEAANRRKARAERETEMARLKDESARLRDELARLPSPETSRSTESVEPWPPLGLRAAYPDEGRLPVLASPQSGDFRSWPSAVARQVYRDREPSRSERDGRFGWLSHLMARVRDRLQRRRKADPSSEK